MSDRFKNAYTGEKLILAFDYSAELAAGETVTGTPTVEITVTDGVDPAPDALKNGLAEIVAGGVVLQPIDPLVADVGYRLKVLADTSNPLKRLACVGKLYVES